MKKQLNNKLAAVLLSLVLLVTVSVGGTLAVLADRTNPVVNSFGAARVACHVLSGGQVKNTGTAPVKIRAAVVTNWVDAKGNVHWQQPACTVTAGSGWQTGADGFYYYSSEVPSGSVTTALKATLNSGQTAPEGYTLQVLIAAEALQVLPDGAVPVWQ